MRKKVTWIASLLTRPLFLYVINPLFFLLAGIFFTLFYNPVSNFTVLVYPPENIDKITYPKGELLKGKKISAEFTARDSNLGIVSVRFDNFERISTDSVLFRIREKNTRDWFYQNTYTVGQFQPNEFFPFGFPVIADSGGKKYLFEVISLYGKHDNAIGRSEQRPYFTTSYQFPRHEIFGDKERFINYVYEKRIKSTLEFKDSIVRALYYFLPIGLYLFVVVFLDQICRRRPTLAIGAVLFITALEILAVSKYRTDLLLIIGLLWVVTFFRKRIDGRVSFFLSLCLIVFIPLGYLLGSVIIADKLARWMYILMILGVFMKLLERKRPALINYKKLLS